MFAAMLFAAVTGETALLIYKSHRSVRFEEKLVSLLSLFILLSALILFPQDGDADTGLCRLPWVLVAVLLILAVVHHSVVIPMASPPTPSVRRQITSRWGSALPIRQDE